MKTLTPSRTLWLAPSFACALSASVHAQLVSNGGFESGLTGWTTADQLGSDGTFFVQTGTSSPVNSFVVPAPPGGIRSAMTDAGAGGSHVLYQDFVVPTGVTLASAGFSLFVNNGAQAYSTPANLDWAAFNQSGALNLNQQARVDIMTTSADVFSVDAAAVLQNLFQTTAATPLVFGYTPFNIDITALLQAHAGETLRLRFAETDNVNFFNLGVDEVSVNFVPAPSSLLLASAALTGLTRRRRR